MSRRRSVEKEKFKNLLVSNEEISPEGEIELQKEAKYSEDFVWGVAELAVASDEDTVSDPTSAKT